MSILSVPIQSINILIFHIFTPNYMLQLECFEKTFLQNNIQTFPSHFPFIARDTANATQCWPWVQLNCISDQSTHRTPDSDQWYCQCSYTSLRSATFINLQSTCPSPSPTSSPSTPWLPSMWRNPSGRSFLEPQPKHQVTLFNNFLNSSTIALLI